MLPLIILVWGFVFYQLFSYFFSSPTFAKEENIPVINIDEIKTDTFSIVADYRDPFLGSKTGLKQHANYAVKKNTNVHKTAKKTPDPVDKAWPPLKYKGMIKNNNSNRRVGIIEINGKENLVREGDVVHDVKVITINKQSVKVSFQKENRIITK